MTTEIRHWRDGRQYREEERAGSWPVARSRPMSTCTARPLVSLDGPFCPVSSICMSQRTPPSVSTRSGPVNTCKADGIYWDAPEPFNQNSGRRISRAFPKKKRWKLLMCSRRFGVWINSSSLHSGKICSPTCRVLSSCQVMIYGDQQTIWSLQQEEEVSTGWNWTYKRKRKKKKLRICFPSFSSKEASCCWGRRHSLCWTALLCERRLERQQTGASINTMNPTQTATSSKRIISKDFGTHEGIGATSLNWRKRPLSDEVRPESKCVGAVSDKAPSKWIDCRCRRIAFSLPSLPSFE